jgi:uncharacterized protein YdeI (YjbR/CyaY-like superfamily)
MKKTNPLFDAYIEKAAPFAQPILKHIRKLVHTACTDVTETIKWGFPHFDYKDAMMCSMAAFKQHCAFGFHKAVLMKDTATLTGKESHTAMGNMGKITSVKDLPSDKKMLALMKEAMMLNDKNIKIPKNINPKYPKKELEVPGYFLTALKKNKKAYATFENFSPSHKREYTGWVTGAKTEETRQRRLEKAIAMMTEGKNLNAKYEKK